MASRSKQHGRFVAPPSSSDSETSSAHHRIERRRRDANLYDAIAGRVTTTLPLDEPSYYQRASLRDATLAPEEVLFRRIGAPIRYAEKDIYHAHERLPDAGRDMLPDSDMLKSIHRYASHFYGRLPATEVGKTSGGHDKENIDERTMDETALLAFGILLEEVGREALGKRGDMVFTEGVQVRDEGCRPETHNEAVSFLDVAPPLTISRRHNRIRLSKEQTR
ncbi:uncharacterized protein BCR38DRAFT_423984 [Pseudomassariella vexata]|uniref:Uncharacterized protein n=1 Tax=Pseudomassariella vexata TaxID=1141098 RepID=A0A1Y2EB81_9PEZI|nr:uncharacterized protein BCR38DRAFT_423984 [Pseudomassariella vexata]ORY68667.1 hypothetical protein BCR38DRAFT_423984 [Pseudomassariella vexata]